MPFVTLEGIEGCGKSTQARLLAEALGPEAVLTREPGGTALGHSVRELLLHRPGRVEPAAEVLLYFADRAQHVAEVIRPALAAGLTVVCDRYVDSSYAYQGYGRGLPLELLQAAWRLATGGLTPDVTVFIDVPVELGLARIGQRGALDRLEGEARAFHERVRAGYLALAAAEPGRWLSVDGTAPERPLAEQLQAAVLQRLGVRLDGVR